MMKPGDIVYRAHVLVSILWALLYFSGAFALFFSGSLVLTHVIAGVLVEWHVRQKQRQSFDRPVLLLVLDSVGLFPIVLYGWQCFRMLSLSIGAAETVDTFARQAAIRMWTTEYPLTICVCVLLGITLCVHLMTIGLTIWYYARKCNEGEESADYQHHVDSAM